MPIEIQCPSCARKYTVAEKHIGRKVVCAVPTCAARFVASAPEIQSQVSIAEEIAGVFENNQVIESVDSFQQSIPKPIDTREKMPAVLDPNEVNSAFDSVSKTQEPESTENLLMVQKNDPAQGDTVSDNRGRSQTAFWGMAKKVLGDASSHVSNVGVAVTSKAASLGSTGVGRVAEVGKQTFNAANSAMDSTGVKDALKATATVVSGKLDEVSGKRLVELLEKKLQIQDSYNDILATRLAEALDRIQQLEERFSLLVTQVSSNPSSSTEITN